MPIACASLVHPACPSQITGGGPTDLASPLTLCAHPDLEPGRFLSGALSNLMLFDQALSAGQVAALHRDYLRDAVTSPLGVTSGLLRTTVSGQNCSFPIHWSGALVYDCVVLSGQPSCPVGDGSWEPCTAMASSDAAAGSTPAAGAGSRQDGAAGAVTRDASGAANGSVVAKPFGRLPRVTRGGQACLLPFSHDGRR
jgi:hypothetical protein